MIYHLSAQNGDSVAVPQLVFSQLERTDGDTVRVALYLLKGGSCDPRTIAHDLALKSAAAAERALQFWAGAGLLERERGTLPAPPPTELRTEEVCAAAMTDPLVVTLVQETQSHLGRALSHKDLQRVVSFYAIDSFPVDVILLCVSHLAARGKHTVAALERELHRWRDNGVETGEDAEKYLRREEARAAFWQQAARAFGVSEDSFTQAERRSINRWHEDWGFGVDMVEEAVLRAESHKTVRYVDGILRSWHGKGWQTVRQVRGSGSLQGSNILATGAVQTPAASAANDPFQQNWSAVFDHSAEG